MDSKEVETSISSLHKLISQTETSLLLMRAELDRLKKIVEPSADNQAAPNNPPVINQNVIVSQA